MSSTYGNFAIVLPTAGSVSWDGPLNDALQTIADVLDTLVGANNIQIQSDLDLRGQALVNVRALDFSDTTDPGLAENIFFSNNELWVRDGANNAIQITSNGHILLSGLGGFGGQYNGTSAGLATYTTSNTRFTFLTNSTDNSVADIEGGNVRLRQGTATSAVILRAPAGLATDVTVTMPSTMPASGIGTATVPVLIDATGTLMFGGPVQDVLRGQYVKWLHPAAGVGTPTNAPNIFYTGGGAPGGSVPSNWIIGLSGSIDYPLDVEPGTRIVQVDMWCNPDPAVRLTASLNFTDMSAVGLGHGNVRIAARTANTASAGTAAPISLSSLNLLTGTMPHVAVSTGSYFVRLEAGGNPSLAASYGVKLTLAKLSGTLT